jgi:transposase
MGDNTWLPVQAFRFARGVASAERSIAPPVAHGDAAPEARLFSQAKTGIKTLSTPDFKWMKWERRHKHVTRRLLWRKYQAQHLEVVKYTAFCVKFRQWRAPNASSP